jgi:hypothetical protein
MSRRGRPPNVERPIEWRVNVPENVAAQVELRLLDPVSGRPRYAVRSKLIAVLLERWLSGEIDVPMED